MKVKKHYVYKITNMINGKIYIGVRSAVDPYNDTNYMSSSRTLWEVEYPKYGIENFRKEILRVFNTKSEAYKYEGELVNTEFIRRVDTYNKVTGGTTPQHCSVKRDRLIEITNLETNEVIISHDPFEIIDKFHEYDRWHIIQSFKYWKSDSYLKDIPGKLHFYELEYDFKNNKVINRLSGVAEIYRTFIYEHISKTKTLITLWNAIDIDISRVHSQSRCINLLTRNPPQGIYSFIEEKWNHSTKQWIEFSRTIPDQVYKYQVKDILNNKESESYYEFSGIRDNLKINHRHQKSLLQDHIIYHRYEILLLRLYKLNFMNDEFEIIEDYPDLEIDLYGITLDGISYYIPKDMILYEAYSKLLSIADFSKLKFGTTSKTKLLHRADYVINLKYNVHTRKITLKDIVSTETE